MNYDLLIRWIMDLLMFFLLYLIVTMNLNFMYGFTGIPHFGISLSVAGGGFVAGTLTGRILRWIYNASPGLNYISDNIMITNEMNSKLIHDPLLGISIFILTLILSLFINAGLGYIVSRPAIKLSGSYLIIVFIGMAEAIRIIGLNYKPLVGGTLWVHVPDVFIWLGDFRTEGYLIVVALTTLCIFIILHVMSTSPLARVLKAVRENPLSAKSIGKDVVRIKTRVIMLCSALTSITGVLYAFYIQVVMSTSYSRGTWTFYPWLMFMVGGVGNNLGAAFGTFTFITIRRLIIFFKHDIEAFVPFQVLWLEQIMIGLSLLLIIMFRPEGLIPEKPTKMRGLNYVNILRKIKSKDIKAIEKTTE